MAVSLGSPKVWPAGAPQTPAFEWYRPGEEELERITAAADELADRIAAEGTVEQVLAAAAAVEQMRSQVPVVCGAIPCELAWTQDFVDAAASDEGAALAGLFIDHVLTRRPTRRPRATKSNGRL
ncbi:hypothetical protein GA0074696_2857 [Micromonospora purpureochromogenes]|uniref:Uncharacterized protein n=1 Tax=Micromonospora purpureochromogenes TaxID=47872 RepID=A0A1C4XVN4_9ACTN|nr:hypothetical protein [Micromonospora purpureochromogenes]SCF12161.1 hypothetical protein GA0074696_2857 [Micromonospora purpureochromogenes]